MGDESPTEACGRCAMTTVVDESEMTRVNPVAWTRRVTDRLNATVEQFVYGR